MDGESGKTPGKPERLVNAMTVDVEDWFQVQAFAGFIERESWETRARRVEGNTEKILGMFADAGVKGTFFTLGWVAKRHPDLVRRIVAGGHELASHGYWHYPVHEQTANAFRQDLRRAKFALEDASGKSVAGYRAPTFSINARTPWAYGVLEEEGFAYSSSLFPIRHDNYGTPGAPRFPHRPGAGKLVEIPMTTVRAAWTNLPAAGGGYFRLMPYPVFRSALRWVNGWDEAPAVFYFHPWEIDPGQPRMKQAPRKAQFRHYNNLAKMQPRLVRLLGDFRWGRIDQVFPKRWPSKLRITELAPGGEAAWDTYVARHPQASFFHQAAWAGIARDAFRHRPVYLLAEQDGAVAGILPLVQVRTRLFGHALISTPFCVYGGPLAEDAATARALAAHAAGLAEKLGAPVTELRFRSAPEAEVLGDEWQARDGLYVTFRKPIAGDDEANLKAIPRKQRAVVRKAIERGLTAQSTRDVDLLHRIYAESVRNLGTPVFSRRYFRLLAEVFGEAMEVVTVRDGDVPVASVMNFYWRDEVLPYYGGGTAAARACAANDFMYWEVMRRAAARGCRMFDFGRSKTGTGAFAFKKNWGFAPEPLQYRYHVAAGGKIPENNPLNPKYRLMIATWKRLPLPVAKALGPWLIRGLG